MGQSRGPIVMNENEYAHFFNLSLDLFCIAGIDGYFEHLNPQFQIVLGFTASELTEKPFLEFVHPDDQVATLEAVKQLSLGIKVINFENRYLCKDGTYKTLSWQAVPIGSQIYCTARDITDQKMATEALKQNEKTISAQAALLDLTREAIVLLDTNGSVLYWNRGAEELYGIKTKEAIGSNIIALKIVSLDTFSQITKDLSNFKDWSGETKYIKNEKTELTLESHWRITPSALDVSEAILMICSDITEKKRAQSLALRNQRMESIGTLAGGIAHDLNNMLTPIMMSIELLKMDENDLNRIRILDTMDICVKRGAEMVAQVLSFARGAEGERREIQPNKLLKEVERIITDTFLKSVQIKTAFAPNLSKIQGDQTQLYQVLINLCINARDAMSAGGTLTLSADNVILSELDPHLTGDAGPGSYVLISVEDTGAGMSKETMGRIFEPFFTTKEFGKGTGLGLSTSLAIVKSHRGFMSVYSELGLGTRISLFLPAYINKMTSKAAPIQPELPRGSGEWILVVDDEAAIRQIACQTLEDYGYRVFTAQDGAEAVAIYTIEKETIALVLTDMMMPGMDGAATIRELKKINPNVLVISASGLRSNLNSDSDKYFLTKPFNVETLIRKIRTVLDENSVGS